MTRLREFQRVLVIEIELVVAVACAVYSDLVEGIYHLIAFFDVGQRGRREAIAGEEG